MNYQISSDNMEVSESMKELFKSKIVKLERRWQHIPDESKSLRVVMNSAPEGMFLVKIEANLDGKILYTEEPGYTLETALVDTIDELDRQYLKEKSKYEDKWKEKRQSKVLKEEDLELPKNEEYDYSTESDDDSLDGKGVEE